MAASTSSPAQKWLAWRTEHREEDGLSSAATARCPNAIRWIFWRLLHAQQLKVLASGNRLGGKVLPYS